MMSSWVLEGLRRRLLELAQEDKCSSSAGRLTELEDGAIRKTSIIVVGIYSSTSQCMYLLTIYGFFYYSRLLLTC